VEGEYIVAEEAGNTRYVGDDADLFVDYDFVGSQRPVEGRLVELARPSVGES
jgi:hypothetical protein